MERRYNSVLIKVKGINGTGVGVGKQVKRGIAHRKHIEDFKCHLETYILEAL